MPKSSNSRNPSSPPARAVVKDPRLVGRAVVGLLLVANLAALWQVAFPWGGSADDLGRQISTLSTEVRQRQAELEHTRQVAARVQQGRSEGDKFIDKYFLGSRAASSEVVSELIEAAKESQIKARDHSFALDPIEGSNTLGMMTITGSYEGTYADLIRFVNRLDRSDRLLIIESLNAAPQQGGNLLNVSVKVETFVREDGSPPPANPAAAEDASAPAAQTVAAASGGHAKQ